MRAMFKLTLRLTAYLVTHSPEKTLGRCYFLQHLTFNIKFTFLVPPYFGSLILQIYKVVSLAIFIFSFFCQEPVPDNFPFEIIDEDGMSVVILRRDYKDEKIEVTVSMPNLEGGPEFDDEDGEGDGESSAKDDEEAEEDDESAGDSSISLKVVVSKDSGPKLEFTCTAFREEITIDDMLIVERTDDDGEEKFPYEGPEFT